MANLIGGVVGGVVVVFLLSVFLEWALFKRVTASAASGIPASVIAAALIAIILYGFGNANGGSWNPFPGGIAYIVSAFIVLPLRLRSYHKRRELADADEDLQRTFE